MNFSSVTSLDDVASVFATRVDEVSTKTDITVTFESSRLVFQSGLSNGTSGAGIRLKAGNPSSPGVPLVGNETGLLRPLRHGTGIELSATANAGGISFDAAVGAFGVFIRNGQANLDGSFALFLEPDVNDGDNRHYFRDPTVIEDANGNRENELFGEGVSIGSSIGTEVTATASAMLPTAFPVETALIGDFDVLIDIPEFITYLGDTNAYVVNEIPPNNGVPGIQVQSIQGGQSALTFTYPVFESFDLGDNLFADGRGWNGIFDLAIDAMRGE